MLLGKRIHSSAEDPSHVSSLTLLNTELPCAGLGSAGKGVPVQAGKLEESSTRDQTCEVQKSSNKIWPEEAAIVIFLHTMQVGMLNLKAKRKKMRI